MRRWRRTSEARTRGSARDADVFQNPDAALNRRFSIQRIIARALHRLMGTAASSSTTGCATSPTRCASTCVDPGQAVPALRRPQAARGHRARLRRRPQGWCATSPPPPRRVRAGGDPETCCGAPGGKGTRLPVHLPRPRGRAYLSDRIAVLYLGRLMELGKSETVFGPPQHPYTEALLSAVPAEEGKERPRIRLSGEIPSHADPPSAASSIPAARATSGHLPRAGAGAQGGRAGALLALPLLGGGPARDAEDGASGKSGRASRGSEPEADSVRRPSSRPRRGEQRVLRVSNKPGPGPSGDER